MLTKERNCTNGTLSRCTYAILLLVALMSLAFSSTALAQGQHGIGIVKGCDSPVVIGDPLYCDYTISNTLDTGDGTSGSADTLTVSRLEDFVCNGGIVAGNCQGKNAQPPVPSGDILPLLSLSFTGGASCNGAQTLCTLPPGSTISTALYTHYNVAIDDVDPLPDRIVMVWQDLNDSGSNNPPVGDQEQFTGSTATLTCAPCVNDAECEECNETTNLCEPYSASTTCTSDGSLECWDAGCDGSGNCVEDHTPVSASTTCADDGSNECADAGCDGSGNCVQDHTPVSASTTCTSDGSLECWDAGCDGSGNCVEDHTPVAASTPCADTGDECFDAGCDGSGSCVQDHVPLDCGDEICRTPGFWGARGGDAGDEDYRHGQNITLEVIGDGLDVCGFQITNTDLADPESAIEAICINKGDTQAKLIRNLTSTALNCSLGVCNPNTALLLSDCNDICFAGTDEGAMKTCSDNLDCFNNGGYILADGSCAPEGFGVCQVGGVESTLCEIDEDCDLRAGETCMLFENCHEADLCAEDDTDCTFEPPGPASSPKKCNQARRDGKYIWEY